MHHLSLMGSKHSTPQFSNLGSSLPSPVAGETNCRCSTSEQQNTTPPPTFTRKSRRSSLEQIYEALSRLGLESLKPIFGIDFTKSNEWTGKFSFNRRCLHDLKHGTINPYEEVISTIGRSLPFARENPVLCYGFGDETTNDKKVFDFYNDGHVCRDIVEALSRYRQLVPEIKLAGPTSFAPIIEKALTQVNQSCWRHYHALFIIGDGQITRGVDKKANELSAQEEETINAIVRASKYPLSIFLIGVGDGPWDFRMEALSDCDNFTFINFTEIMSRRNPKILNEVDFDLLLWQTIYSHYRARLELGFLRGNRPRKLLLPHAQESTTHRATPSEQLCTICFGNVRDLAFGCGHRTCCNCGERMVDCPLCRKRIKTRIKLYP